MVINLLMVDYKLYKLCLVTTSIKNITTTILVSKLQCSQFGRYDPGTSSLKQVLLAKSLNMDKSTTILLSKSIGCCVFAGVTVLVAVYLQGSLCWLLCICRGHCVGCCVFAGVTVLVVVYLQG